MPLYNEAKFLRPALDALLAQDYRDLELVISDNGSTDDTEAICREYAARETRIRYHRNAQGIGAIRNFNRVFELSRGEYFMWASGHDLWSPGYLSACIRVLDDDSTVVLCSPHKAKIDAEGAVVRVIPNRIDTRSMENDPVGRLNLFLWAGPHAYTIYGLLRSSALRQTGMFRPVYAPDIVLMAELSVLGCIAQIPDEYHYARYNRASDEAVGDSFERYRRVFFSDQDRPRRWFPYWRFAREFVGAARTGNVSVVKRIGLISSVLVSLGRQRKHLLEELVHLGRGAA
jgi:glycosyltransferase involved in cell wall biosynthesis